MNATATCHARRVGTDQMYCASCRLTWDVNDKDPPPCGRTVRVVERALDTAIYGAPLRSDLHTTAPSGFVSGLQS